MTCSAALLFALILASCASTESSTELKAFVLLDADKFQYINKSQAGVPRSPCSTYKVPHAIFGLEAGYLKGKDFVQKYDSTRDHKKSFWPDAWVKDHTLESAVKNSVVWYFREVARQIGPKRMQTYLSKIENGNEDISGGIDRFWLSSSLEISPKQQVKVLARLLGDDSPLKKENVTTIKEIILWDKSQKHPVHAKTGTCRQSNGNYGAWLVGFVDVEGSPKYFASYLEGSDNKNLSVKRIEFTLNSLKKFGVL